MNTNCHKILSTKFAHIFAKNSRNCKLLCFLDVWNEDEDEDEDVTFEMVFLQERWTARQALE